MRRRTRRLVPVPFVLRALLLRNTKGRMRHPVPLPYALPCAAACNRLLIGHEALLSERVTLA